MFSGIFKTCLTPKNKWELFLFMIYISLYGSKEYDDGSSKGMVALVYCYN